MTDRENNSILMTEKFIYLRTNKQVDLNLYKDRIEFTASKSNFTFRLVDISGTSIARKETSQISSFLTVYVYSKFGSNKRSRHAETFEYKGLSTYNENLKCVQDWHFRLNSLLKDDEKPFLILINPKSGAGKAENIYFERILPVLSEANAPSTLVLTSK
jgi:hypothetical protein